MKQKFSQWFAAIVAIAAVILLIIEGINGIHMIGVDFSQEGFTVVWKEDAPWEFLSTVRSWWYWIMGGASLLFLCICWEKKDGSK